MTALSTIEVYELSLVFSHLFTPLFDFFRLSPTYYIEEREVPVVGQEYIVVPMQNIISSRIFHQRIWLNWEKKHIPSFSFSCSYTVHCLKTNPKINEHTTSEKNRTLSKYSGF